MGLLKNRFCTVEEIQWKDIRNKVKESNPVLFNILEKIKPNNQLSLFKAQYSYGTKIVDRGIFYLPTDDEKYSTLDDRHIPEHVRKRLDYCPIPLSLVLSNANEVFMAQRNRIIPLNYFLPGGLFGVFETVDFLRGKSSDPKWTVTAGARSVFMLPKVTDSIHYDRVKKKYGIQAEVPKNLWDQWYVYGDLAKRNGRIDKWRNEVVFFGREWFDPAYQNQKDLRDFYRYLLEYCLSALDYLRAHTELDLLWEPFTVTLSEKGFKPRPYLMNTVKYLVSIANGIALGFRPAVDNSAAPIDTLQAIFLEDYGIQNYYPHIIQPYKWKDGDNSKPIYYSLSLPIILEGSPYTKTPTNIIDDQRDIRRLLATIQEIAIKNDQVIEYSKSISTVLAHTKFEYFHCVPDINNDIQDSKEIPSTDEDFHMTDCPPFSNIKFCSNSQFMKGCIRISRI